MVGPVALRLGVIELEAKYAMKRRRACRVVGIAPSTFYYRSCRPERAEVRARLRVLAGQRPRWAYRRLHVLLGREGHRLNHKSSSGCTARKTWQSGGGAPGLGIRDGVARGAWRAAFTRGSQRWVRQNIHRRDGLL